MHIRSQLKLIGASLSEPHTGQMVSPAIYDLSIVRHSVNKCPRVLSNSLDYFDFAMCHLIP